MRDKRYLRCMGRKRRVPRSDYGEWLLYLRTKKKLTQDQVKLELAHRTGWSTNSSIIADWETKGFPNREILLALCEIYGCSLESLFCVKKDETGSYEKMDAIIEDVKKQNQAREQSIKDFNKDPRL